MRHDKKKNFILKTFTKNDKILKSNSRFLRTASHTLKRVVYIIL